MEGYAMSKNTAAQADVIHLRQNIQDLLRWRVLEAVQTVIPWSIVPAAGSPGVSFDAHTLPRS